MMHHFVGSVLATENNALLLFFTHFVFVVAKETLGPPEGRSLDPAYRCGIPGAASP